MNILVLLIAFGITSWLLSLESKSARIKKHRNMLSELGWDKYCEHLDTFPATKAEAIKLGMVPSED